MYTIYIYYINISFTFNFYFMRSLINNIMEQSWLYNYQDL